MTLCFVKHLVPNYSEDASAQPQRYLEQSTAARHCRLHRFSIRNSKALYFGEAFTATECHQSYQKCPEEGSLENSSRNHSVSHTSLAGYQKRCTIHDGDLHGNQTPVAACGHRLTVSTGTRTGTRREHLWLPLVNPGGAHRSHPTAAASGSRGSDCRVGGMWCRWSGVIR